MWGANESSTVHRATLDSQGKESDCCRHGARDKYRKDGGDAVPGPEQDIKNENDSEYGNGNRFKDWQQQPRNGIQCRDRP